MRETRIMLENVKKIVGKCQIDCQMTNVNFLSEMGANIENGIQEGPLCFCLYNIKSHAYTRIHSLFSHRTLYNAISIKIKNHRLFFL